MSKLSCSVVQDLLPSYTEDLLSEETRQLVDSHISECKECYDMYFRMKKPMSITTDSSQPNKKTTLYISSLRLWYFLCPFLAFVLQYFDFTYLWHLYEGILLLITIVCLSSQFLSGLSAYGFDMEQAKLWEEANNRGKKKWGRHYASPLSYCLPALFILVITWAVRIIYFFE